MCFSQNLIELWNVSTRPVKVNGLGLSLGEAERNISRREAFFSLLPDTPNVFQEWKRLVKNHGVSGLKVHDARLVAAMHVHAIKTIVTFDVDDFRRYRSITVVHPEELAH